MQDSTRVAGRLLLAGAAIVGVGAAAPPAVRQVVTGPVAVYWMSAQTQTGMGMGGMGGMGGGPGGGRPSMSAMLGMGRGGSDVSRSLVLQLGSSQRPTGEAAAQHLPPQGLGAGPSLPLLTPRRESPVREEPGMPPSYEKPRGRMLIFWGCGETARPGQPLVIDFARVAAGQMPPAFTQAMTSLNISAMQPPSPARNATYGEWPNERTRTQVPGDGSLAGGHTIKGNYSPQIDVALTAQQDFLPPVRMTTNDPLPSGAFQLGWRRVDGATGYVASAMGGDGDTMVMWSSSEVQSLLFALPDYLKPADVSRLVASKALMAPTQTACAVPREVARAAPQAMYQFVAYGDEVNFSYPPRPADPKQAWNIAWTVKVRYRSATSGLLGMEMPGADDDSDEAPDRAGQPPPKPKTKPRGGDILRGLGVPFPGGR